MALLYGAYALGGVTVTEALDAQARVVWIPLAAVWAICHGAWLSLCRRSPMLETTHRASDTEA